MRKLLLPLSVSCLALMPLATVFGQYPADNQVHNQIQSITPQPYQFQTVSGHNYDPYQFNWYSGRWDYVPIPYGSVGGSPYRFNPAAGTWNYAPIQPAAPPPMAAQAQPAGNGSAPPPPPPPSPGITPPPLQAELPEHTGKELAATTERASSDNSLWTPPATQPTTQPSVEHFQGKIVSMRAVDLNGEYHPHLLLRLRNDAGVTMTVDVGERLHLPDNSTAETFTASGKIGRIDGATVMFADQLEIGSHVVKIERK